MRQSLQLNFRNCNILFVKLWYWRQVSGNCSLIGKRGIKLELWQNKNYEQESFLVSIICKPFRGCIGPAYTRNELSCKGEMKIIREHSIFSRHWTPNKAFYWTDAKVAGCAHQPSHNPLLSWLQTPVERFDDGWCAQLATSASVQ